MIKMNFRNAQFDYKPFPICYIPNFFDSETYRDLSGSYPDLSMFHKIHRGEKYSLSETNNKDFYSTFLKENPNWDSFYQYVKSKVFVEELLEFLKANHIDLGIKTKIWYMVDGKKVTKWTKAIAVLFKRKLMTSKFEFSALPANGGYVVPHTDSINKIITLVVSLYKDGEWNSAWGGGTVVNCPKDETKTYNQTNKTMPLEEMETLKTFPFEQNQCVLFIKTYDSWHSVAKMTGPDGSLRKTLTINIKSFN